MIGLIDLDTSHPQAWLPILRELGYPVVAVFDGGTVHRPGYADDFAGRNYIPHVFDSVEEMAQSPDVRIAIVHSCDWDVHVKRAAPFIATGKAVLIDKPIVGRPSDLQTFSQWAKAGARIAGGSSLRCCDEVSAYRASIAEKGQAQAIFAGCGVDEFNYGIHAYALACGLMGHGVRRVRHAGCVGERQQVELHWNDGRRATLLIGGNAWLPFHITLTRPNSVEYVEAKTDTLYRRLLERTLPYLGGEVDQPPTSFDEWIEPELSALAALWSRQHDGAFVELTDVLSRHGWTGYDGAAFASEYRAMKLGSVA
jgi:hypothetical protein